jgi:hypothetical protein
MHRIMVIRESQAFLPPRLTTMIAFYPKIATVSKTILDALDRPHFDKYKRKQNKKKTKRNDSKKKANK